MTASTNVFLLEFPDEVETFLKHCREQDVSPNSFHVVALWPNVQVVLRRAGVTYHDTRPYFDNDSHERIIKLSENWLRGIEEGLDLSDDSGITQTYNAAAVFQLRFYINYFLWLLEILEGINRGLRGLRGFLSVSSASSAVEDNPSLTSNDRFLGAITSSFANAQGLEYRTIPHQQLPSAPKKKSLNLFALPNSILHRWTLSRIPSGPRILVTEISYNMDRLIRELKAQFPNARFVWLNSWPSPPSHVFSRLLKPAPSDFYLSLENLQNGAPPQRAMDRLEPGLQKLAEPLPFRHHGVSFSAIFGKKIERDLLPHIRNLAARSQTIQRVLKTVRPSLVLTAFSADADAVLGEWTRVLGIPSLSISHGTFTPSESNLDMIEKERLGTTLLLTSFQHTALQTPWAEKFISQIDSSKRPKPLKTGDLIFARLNPELRRQARRAIFGENAGDEMKLVVYATTLKARSTLRFQIHETLDEHLEGIADLAKALKDVEGATLLVKLHPAAALKEDEVKELVPETRAPHVRVACRMPFEKVLSAADLLVSYSSTCIEEAILNNVPVLLYDPWKRYQHLPAYRWGTGEAPHSMPAYYVNDSKLAAGAIRWILANHRPGEIPAEVRQEYVFPPETQQEFIRFVSESLNRG